MNKRTKFIAIVFILSIFLVVSLLSTCKSDPLSSFKESVTITFTTNKKECDIFKLKVARTMYEKAKGLMYVKHLPEKEGIIFIYDNESEHTFWMKNTFIPLDMIFINTEKEIVGIIKNTTILSEESLSINKPSKYIIEVNAGVADKYGLTVGTNVNGEF